MTPPSALRRAALLVGLEGLALAGTGATFIVVALTGDRQDRAGTVLLFAIVLGIGLALLPVARALDRGLGWAWAPTILVQIFTLIAAVGAFQADSLAVAVPLALLAGVTLYQLALPEARAARQD